MWLPMETLVYEHQEEYYATLRQADQHADSTLFIEFILQIILDTIESYNPTKMSDKLSKVEKNAYLVIMEYLHHHESINSQIAQELLQKSAPTVRRYLNSFVEHNLLITIGDKKSRIYKKGKVSNYST